MSFPEYEAGIAKDRFGPPQDRIPSVLIVHLSEEIGWPAVLVGAIVALELALPWLDVVGEHIGYPWPENLGDVRRGTFIGKPLEAIPEYAVWLWARHILDRRWIPREAEYGLRGPLRLRDELRIPTEPAYRPFSPENEPVYQNYYYCPKCEAEWTDVWTAMSDDTCPECGARNIQPERSEEFYEHGDPTDEAVDAVRELVRGVARAVNEVFAIYDVRHASAQLDLVSMGRAVFELDQAVQRLGAIGAALGYPRHWLTQQWMEEVKRRLPIARGVLESDVTGARDYTRIQQALVPSTRHFSPLETPRPPAPPDWEYPFTETEVPSVFLSRLAWRLSPSARFVCAMTAVEMAAPIIDYEPANRLIRRAWDAFRAHGAPLEEDLYQRLEDPVLLDLAAEHPYFVKRFLEAIRWAVYTLRHPVNAEFSVGPMIWATTNAVESILWRFQADTSDAAYQAQLDAFPQRQWPNSALGPLLDEWWARCRARLAIRNPGTAVIKGAGYSSSGP